MTRLLQEPRIPPDTEAVAPYRRTSDGSAAGLVRTAAGGVALHVVGNHDGFRGKAVARGVLCPLTPENAAALSERFPWLRPRRLPDDRPSFGFGDRLGMATPGHLRALPPGSPVFPILAQQSVRENERTGRSFADVLAAAVFGAFREGYDHGFGADADHLKEVSDALEAARLGYRFFTCDPSDHVEPTETLAADGIRARFTDIPDSQELAERYVDRSYAVGDEFVLRFSDEELMRVAVKYTGAIDQAARTYEALAAEIGDAFDYEVSVDETDSPTSPLEHLFVALELRRRGVGFVSLAPRFAGAMEKGVDWRGDPVRFASDLAGHAAIAKSLGGYRLSLHSGSDKFSLYPSIARATDGRCHVKTAGTSYLVALEVVARRDPALFRCLAARAFEAFEADRTTYAVSADPLRVPPIERLADERLPDLVTAHDSRQVLHVTFGSILRSPDGDAIRRVLAAHEQDHFAALASHLGRHIDGLEVTSNG